MTTKFVKVMFRAKGGPRHAFKVFTNVRMAGKRHPVQIHLCYVPDREHLTEQDQEKIQKALEEQWRERLNKKRVRILLDWTDAKEKWAKRKTPKKWKVDRTNAKKQIDAWMKDDNSDPIEAYTHLKPESQSAAAWFGIDEKSFKERFLELSMQLDDKTPGADFKDVTDWWENLEAPRLLEAFARYAKREDSVFGPRSYLAYLGRNIGVGYASKQFLRAHPNAVARLQTIRAHLDDIDI